MLIIYYLRKSDYIFIFYRVLVLIDGSYINIYICSLLSECAIFHDGTSPEVDIVQCYETSVVQGHNALGTIPPITKARGFYLTISYITLYLSQFFIEPFSWFSLNFFLLFLFFFVPNTFDFNPIHTQIKINMAFFCFSKKKEISLL